MVGIIIVNYNTYHELLQCVDSIKETCKTKYKIYIVDNGSDKKIQDRLLRQWKQREEIEVLVSDENLGYSAGNNIGIKKAVKDGARYIAIVNSDIVFQNDVISIMLKNINKEVAVVGPRVYNLAGEDGQQLIVTYNYFYALLDRVPFYYLKKFFSIGMVKPEQNRIQKYYGMVSGCCFLIDAEVFKRIGYFDENVFLYSEERILSIKLRQIHRKVCYNPRAVVVHREGQSTKKKGNAFADYHRYASDYYTVRRYCKYNNWEIWLFRKVRELNFYLKSVKNTSYLPYYKKLKSKFDEIDHRRYKIIR